MALENANIRWNRRSFLRAGVVAGASAVTAHLVPSHVLGRAGQSGANQRVHIGVIGLGARGKSLIGDLPEPVRVTALCDCVNWRTAETVSPKPDFAQILARFRDRDAAQCAIYQDYRRMLDREKLDAVIIATPDHHHVLSAMLACEAGLDVYVEKPLSLTIAEGRRFSETVQRTGRVVQIGSQQRTMEMNRFACEFVRDGGLGRVSKIELSNYPGPLVLAEAMGGDASSQSCDAGYRVPAERVPAGIDWDLFCGPTSMRPYNRRVWLKDEFRVGNLLWRGWDLWRSYSGHMMTNWGAHSVDMAQYALGRDDSGPVEIWPVQPASVPPLAARWIDRSPPSGDIDGLVRVAKERRIATSAVPSIDQRRFWPVFMRYDDGVELHFVQAPESLVIHGERGTMHMQRNYFRVDPPELVVNAPDPQVTDKWKGPGYVARPHLENWLHCVKTRQTPNAPVEVGHRTVTICHLANIARQLHRRLRWDPKQERFPEDDEANRLLDRPRRKGFELPA